MSLLFIFLILLIVIYLFFEHRRYKRKLDSWVNLYESNFASTEKIDVIDMKSFDVGSWVKITRTLSKMMKVFEPNARLKLLLFLLISFAAVYFINDIFFRFTYWKCLLVIEPVMFLLFFNKVKQHRESLFRNDFPDALNILTSAMSSGQGIVQSFEYVGEQLDNQVGNEFEYMAKRLLIGEDPDEVLERSCMRFPYVEYFFFISAIRVNIARGGQLKEVMSRINRLIFISRNIDKKKSSLTSEARMSAKIIGFLPLVFLLILYFTNRDNYNFVMYEDAGRSIFYYVVISEFIGFFIIWLILKSVD